MQVAILLLPLAATPASPEECSAVHSVAAGTTSLSVSNGSGRVMAQVSARKSTAKDAFGPRYKRGQFPEHILTVTELILRVNGESLFVPRSVFLDLAGTRSARLCWSDQAGRMVLSGGDGAESFRVELTFDRTAVKHRAVFSGELPGLPLEETTYHQRSL